MYAYICVVLLKRVVVKFRGVSQQKDICFSAACLLCYIEQAQQCCIAVEPLCIRLMIPHNIDSISAKKLLVYYIMLWCCTFN
nr:hypothetical protein Iba_chr08dCG11830 [Ipomoea batatas]